MKKLVENISLLIAFTLLISIMSGCEKSVKHKDEVSIKDIIEDKEMHFIYVTHAHNHSDQTDYGYLTKNGKIKRLYFDQPIETSEVIKTKPKDIEKKFDIKKDDGVQRYKNWTKVKSYGRVVDPDGNPVTTTLFSKKITKKSFENEGTKGPINNEFNMIFQYEFTNVETHQESDKKKVNIGSFSMRPDKEIKTKAKILNKDEDEIYKDFDIKERSYTIYNVVLPKNVKKLKDLDPDDKDVLTTKYGDNMTY